MQEHGTVIRLNSGEATKALDSGAMKIVNSSSTEREAIVRQWEAYKIFGMDFLGSLETAKALNITIPAEDVPDIPFTKEDLSRAKELGQRLVLRVSNITDGVPITMHSLNKHLESTIAGGAKRFIPGRIAQKILYNMSNYYKEQLFTTVTPRSGWALVTNEVIPDSTNKNYLEQTETISNYLKHDVFKDGPPPKEYADSITEFEEQYEEIKDMLGVRNDDVQQIKASLKLIDLNITKLTRATAVEVLYDQLAYFQHTRGKRLLEGNYTWTSSLLSTGGIMTFGNFDIEGMGGGGTVPSSSRNQFGVCLSRM